MIETKTMAEAKLRHYKWITDAERIEIAKIHFWDEDIKKKQICEQYGISVEAYNKTIDAARTDKIVSRDNELLELVTFANVKFAKETSAKKRIPIKEMETLDKLANSAMKRLAVAHAVQDALAKAEETGKEPEPLNIQVKF